MTRPMLAKTIGLVKSVVSYSLWRDGAAFEQCPVARNVLLGCVGDTHQLCLEKREWAFGVCGQAINRHGEHLEGGGLLAGGECFFGHVAGERRGRGLCGAIQRDDPDHVERGDAASGREGEVFYDGHGGSLCG